MGQRAGVEARVYTSRVSLSEEFIVTNTTVFQSGNSQAVRLPKEFRFTSKTVEIFRRGNEVVLREKPRTMGDLIRDLPAIDDDFTEHSSHSPTEHVPSWDEVK